MSTVTEIAPDVFRVGNGERALHDLAVVMREVLGGK